MWRASVARPCGGRGQCLTSSSVRAPSCDERRGWSSSISSPVVGAGTSGKPSSMAGTLFSSASVWKMIWRRFSSLQDAQVTRTRARLPCWARTLIPQSAMFSPHAEQRYRRAWKRSNSSRSITDQYMPRAGTATGGRVGCPVHSTASAGEWPSGKAADSGSANQRFESSLPSHLAPTRLLNSFRELSGPASGHKSIRRVMAQLMHGSGFWSLVAPDLNTDNHFLVRPCNDYPHRPWHSAIAPCRAHHPVPSALPCRGPHAREPEAVSLLDRRCLPPLVRRA